MIRPSWDEARHLAWEAGSAVRLPPTEVALRVASGRVTSDPVVAHRDIPHYASSAMDGWLVSGAGPWRVIERSAVGVRLRHGEARRIRTGGAVPAEATAVLRDESARVHDGVVTSTNPAEPREGQHIRWAGREAATGETLIPAGTVLNPAHVALAASAGLDALAVLPRPRIDLLVTGDELTDAGDPESGRVRDGFSYQFPALFGLMGAELGMSERVRDDARATVAALVRSTSPLQVTTGGTGASDADHLRGALTEMGAHLVFDGIAVRPGGPAFLARLPGDRIVLGLPGNPLAALVTMIGVGSPLIAGLAGREPAPRRRESSHAIEGRPDATVVVPYALDADVAVPRPWAEVSMMRGLAAADGLLVVPPGGVREGDDAEVIPVPWLR